jgi:hypothetical protein
MRSRWQERLRTSSGAWEKRKSFVSRSVPPDKHTMLNITSPNLLGLVLVNGFTPRFWINSVPWCHWTCRYLLSILFPSLISPAVIDFIAIFSVCSQLHTLKAFYHKVSESQYEITHSAAIKYFLTELSLVHYISWCESDIDSSVIIRWQFRDRPVAELLLCLFPGRSSCPQPLSAERTNILWLKPSIYRSSGSGSGSVEVEGRPVEVTASLMRPRRNATRSEYGKWTTPLFICHRAAPSLSSAPQQPLLDFLLSPLFPPFLHPEVCYLALRWWLSLLYDHQMNHLNIFKSVLHPWSSGLQIRLLVGAPTV